MLCARHVVDLHLTKNILKIVLTAFRMSVATHTFSDVGTDTSVASSSNAYVAAMLVLLMVLKLKVRCSSRHESLPGASNVRVYTNTNMVTL